MAKMSYDRLGNVHIRDNGKKINIFDKIHHIKEDLNAVLPEIGEDMLLTMMSHCRRHYEGKLHYGRRGPENLKKKRDLTNNEYIMYDYLLKQNLNPSTTYRWFLATRIPSDIKERLSKGKLSYKMALTISANRKRVKESNNGLLMMEEINNVVRSL